MLVEASYSKHNGEVSDFAVAPGPRNSIVFRETDVRTLADEQLGGFGLDDVDRRDTEGYKGTAVVQVADHAFHGGVEFLRNSNFRDTVYDGGLYTSLAAPLSWAHRRGVGRGQLQQHAVRPDEQQRLRRLHPRRGPGCRTARRSTRCTTATATGRSRRTSSRRASSTTARRAIRTAPSTTSGSCRPSWARRTPASDGLSFLRAGHVQRHPAASRSTSGSARSASRTSPPTVPTSSPSTGRSRRG